MGAPPGRASGLWFRIMAARYNVVHEEISLHWDNVVSEQPHMIHSSAIYYGAKEIPCRGGNCQTWLLRKRGPQKRKHPYFVFLTLCCRVSIFRQERRRRPLYSLFLRTSFCAISCARIKTTRGCYANFNFLRFQLYANDKYVAGQFNLIPVELGNFLIQETLTWNLKKTQHFKDRFSEN